MYFMKNCIKIILVFSICIFALIGCTSISENPKSGEQPTIEQLEAVQDHLMEHAEELGIVSVDIIEDRHMIEVGYLVANTDFDKNKVIDFVENPDILTFVELLSIEDD